MIIICGGSILKLRCMHIIGWLSKKREEGETEGQGRRKRDGEKREKRGRQREDEGQTEGRGRREGETERGERRRAMGEEEGRGEERGRERRTRRSET